MNAHERLIAAAPDLMAALEKFMLMSDNLLAEGYELDDDELAAREAGLHAIAKAKGEK